MSNLEGERGDKSVLDALEKAAARQMTPEERYQQKLSFIVGTMGGGCTMTREEVQRILEEQEA